MLIAVDIGNTSISLGVLKKRNVLCRYAVETVLPERERAHRLVEVLGKIHKRYPAINKAMMCSVVPEGLKAVEPLVQKQFGMKPVVVGRDKKVPVKNNYRNPRQVGQDRILVAYAAKCLYGQPVIVIDFGTAITFDVVSSKGHYEGGIIVPGIRLSAESLFQKTALLPRIENIQSPKALIGKDTKESILSGLFNGYGALCCGLIDQITSEIKGSPKVIVTGGYTHMMKKFISKKINRIDPHLVFVGMALLADE